MQSFVHALIQSCEENQDFLQQLCSLFDVCPLKLGQLFEGCVVNRAPCCSYFMLGTESIRLIGIFYQGNKLCQVGMREYLDLLGNVFPSSVDQDIENKCLSSTLACQ